jgi:hypothetical protein
MATGMGQSLKDMGKESSTITGTLGRMLGNERGSIGGVNPQVHTPEFKNWFGDWENAPEQASKVVDDEGKPLVVYHGTNENFDIFDFNKIGTGGWSSRGGEKNASLAGDAIYTTSSKSHARDYGDNQIPLYVDIKKPLKYDAKQAILDWKEESGAEEKSIEEFIDDMGGAYNAVDADALFNRLIRQAKQNGNDGVIVDFGDIGDEGKVIIPFKNNQIKSATGNSGKFSPSNPDIRGSSTLGMLGLTGLGAGGLLAGGMYAKQSLGSMGKKK